MKLMIFLMLLSAFKLSEAGQQETLYGHHSSYVYAFYRDGSDDIPWDEGDFKCGWYNFDRMVMIKTSSINEDVSELMDAWGSKHPWIGMNDIHTEGYFHWNDGTKLSDGFQNWNTGEPNDQKGEDCGVLISPSMYWNDGDCGEKYGFICAKPSNRMVPLDSSEFIISDPTSDDGYDGSLANARQRCLDQGYRLAEVTTNRVITEIKKNKKWNPSTKYWIGGSKRCLNSDRCDGNVQYICEAYHSYDLKLSTDQMDFMESDTIKIDCTASGLPLPNVTWYNHNAVVSSETIKQTYQISVRGKSTLVIENAKLEDTARYRCLASNRINNGTRKTKIYTDIRIHPKTLAGSDSSLSLGGPNSNSRSLEDSDKNVDSPSSHECSELTMASWMLPTIFALNILIMLALFVLMCSKRSSSPKSAGNEFTNYAVYATSTNGERKA